MSITSFHKYIIYLLCENIAKKKWIKNKIEKQKKKRTFKRSFSSVKCEFEFICYLYCIEFLYIFFHKIYGSYLILITSPFLIYILHLFYEVYVKMKWIFGKFIQNVKYIILWLSFNIKVKSCSFIFNRFYAILKFMLLQYSLYYR